ncbi:MAG: penicillin-binding protein 1C [Saprospiraceae bacterium]|nr:penicillin-binding protein 1C [Saprospiraceae bacterium]
MQESVRRLSRFVTNKSIGFKCAFWALLLIIIFLISAMVAAPELLQRQHYARVVYDSSNQLLGARLSRDGQWRFSPVDDLPDRYMTCLKQYEDKRFDLHLGIDPIAIGRAIYLNLKRGEISSGGSTITMQLARLLCKHKNRSLWNKLIECWYAVGLELNYSKKNILCYYASFAPYGGNVVGLDAALWRYFQRNHRELSWAEAALLAVLPNQPSWLHLQRNRHLLFDKRNRLLHELLKKAYINANELELALQEPLPETLHLIPQHSQGLLDDLINNYPHQYRFYTSIDLNLQLQLQEIIRPHAKLFRGNEIHNLAVLVVDNNTGKVLSYIPNSQNKDDTILNQQVNNIHSLRSSGSILKPLLYAAAIEKGIVHAGKLMEDIPTTYGNFSPQNFTKSYYGAVTARDALQQSLNIPAVRLLKEYGLSGFHDKLQNLGFTSFKKPSDHYGLSLILGGGEVSVWELAKVYSNLAFQYNQYHAESDRRKWKFRKDLSLLKTDESNLWDVEYREVLKIPAIFQMFDLMKGAPDLWNELPFDRLNIAKEISWKTGTSFGFKDAWCVGISPDITLVVWIGNSNGLGRPGLIGVHTAAPLLFDLAAHLKMSANWKRPIDIMYPNIVCLHSGMEKSMYCKDLDTVWTVHQATSFGLCKYHKQFYLDKSKRYRVTKACDPEAQADLFFVLSPIMEYFYKQHHLSYASLPPWREDCQNSDAYKDKELEIIYPMQSSSIYIPVDLDLAKNQIIFKATHKNPEARLFWFLDDAFLGTTLNSHTLQTSLRMGQHRLMISDDRGQTASITFQSRHSKL